MEVTLYCSGSICEDNPAICPVHGGRGCPWRVSGCIPWSTLKDGWTEGGREGEREEAERERDFTSECAPYSRLAGRPDAEAYPRPRAPARSPARRGLTPPPYLPPARSPISAEVMRILPDARTDVSEAAEIPRSADLLVKMRKQRLGEGLCPPWLQRS